MTAGPEKNVNIGMLLDLYGALLTDRQREVMDLYYNDDLSLSEVSEECGITRQGVREALVKGEELLRDFESRLGLLAKQAANERTLSEILTALDALTARGIAKEETEQLKEKIASLF